ncbi:MAG: SUMF1/EgtB/PvdO family nonheme iron enzyme [Gammaproteobacteria bacterium]|nr:SUMF1/EgtB/PvdO family nonheme iron enzyme [Gammaproteobacteria bacterium]
MPIFEELKRRNVVRVGIAYVVGAWVIVEASSLILDIYEYPGSVMRLVVALLALGLPFVLFFAWAFEVTPDGIKRDSDVDRSSQPSGQTGGRLNLVTIAFVVIAIGLFAIDRFALDSTQALQEPTEASVQPEYDAASLAQQVLEVNRLRDAGDYPSAFVLATEIAPVLGDDGFDAAFWDEISQITDIASVPPAARVYRQPITAGADDWEDLGTTPLSDVRFARGAGYRVRLELDGHRPVEVLHTAIVGLEYFGIPSLNPVKLDSIDTLPEEMLRVRAFTHDLVDYDDFFMDRFEVTNRAFEQFVAAGGYENSAHWQQAFVKDGATIPFTEAVAEFVDKTGRPGPATWSGGAYPGGQGDYPVGGISWYEAAAYAEFMGKQLPTAIHFERTKEFFRENSWLVSPRSNLESDGPQPVGEGRAMTTTGLFDIVGNVREWIWNESGTDQRGTTGAAWPDSAFHSSWIIPKSPWDRDATHGARLVKTFDDEAKLEKLRLRADPEFRRDFMSETPASKAEFDIYKRLYAYDPLPLNAELLWEREDEHWVRQRVAFDTPYGERGGAFVYVPKNVKDVAIPILVWPGSGYLSMKSDAQENWIATFDFLVRSGHIVVLPIFMGAYDRDDADFSITHSHLLENAGGTQYRDIQIKWMQDLSRTIDYLETRDDVDVARLGYSGISWGGQTAPIALALEDRIAAAVLHVGGLWEYFQFLPEADPINFITQVSTPVLMLNGQYDIVFPYETGQIPMFELLGTAPEQKKHYVTPGAHIVPRDILIRETLDWFDKYLD